jgi:hypothetical protein
MPRHPARAVLIARRKFAGDELSIFGLEPRWDYGPTRASRIVVHVDAIPGQLPGYNTKCAIQIGEGQSCAKCCILRKMVKNTVFNVSDYKGFISCPVSGLWNLKCTTPAKMH